MKDVFEEKKDEREGGQKSEFSFGESLSEEKEGPAWYEKSAGEDAWYKADVKKPSGADLSPQKDGGKRENPVPSLPQSKKEAHKREFENLNDVFEGGRDKPTAKKKRKDRAAKAVGDRVEESEEKKDNRVYLPAHLGESETDKIENPADYLRDNFERNPSVKIFRKSRKKQKLIVLGVCVSLLFLSYTCIEEGGPFFLAGLAGIAAAFLFLLIALLIMALKKSAYADSGKFFLVKPYAVKAVYGVLHGFDGAAVIHNAGSSRDEARIEWEKYDEDRYDGEEIRLADCALKLYYKSGEQRREAVTEKIYTEEQIQTIMEAFLRGELVVACRKKRGLVSDKAVVCEPIVPVLT